MNILDTLSAFLLRHRSCEKPLLVAVSGGGDSVVLLHALVELGISCEVAHVDHNWHASSQKDALWVKTFAESLGLRCHIGELDPPKKGNKEAMARAGRIAFLTTCAKKIGAEAILLGHHRKDQAETILKGVFQGNAVPYFFGMKGVAHWNKVAVWRPFLSIPKELIETYLKEKKLKNLEDPSNQDSTYLRVRMRKKILPELSSVFGKNIEGPLCRLGSEMEMLQGYFGRKTAHLLETVVSGPFGYYLPNIDGAEPLELRYLLRAISPVVLPVTIVEQAVLFLVKGVSNKVFSVKGLHLHIDRKRVFFQTAPFPGPKDWELQTGYSKPLSDPIKGFWLGEIAVLLPSKYEKLAFASPNEPYKGTKTLGKWWNEKKVPAFLRGAVPVLMDQGKVVQEFLSGGIKTDSVMKSTGSIKLISNKK